MPDTDSSSQAHNLNTSAFLAGMRSSADLTSSDAAEGGLSPGPFSLEVGGSIVAIAWTRRCRRRSERCALDRLRRATPIAHATGASSIRRQHVTESR